MKLRETWDSIWNKRELLDIDEIIASDSCYHLLKQLIGPMPTNGLNILEVGCGSGVNTLALLRKPQGDLPSLASLVDFSSTALTFARRNAERNGMHANYVLADAFKLPFPDGTFDIVHNAGVNEHFRGEMRQLIFNEMARVCKPGGQVIVIVPNAFNLSYRLWKKILEVQGRWDYGMEMPFSSFELRSKLKNAGLVPVKVSGEGTLASLLFLFRLFSSKRKQDSEEPLATVKGHQILRNVRKIGIISDSYLGFIGGFTGAEIGIKAVKPD
jgi:SAM-dependent methyltransferase